jgi:hypothetical protein
MRTDQQESLAFCGRVFTAGEIDLVRQIVSDFPRLSQHELAHTVCELLEWRRPNGGLKSPECVDLLDRLRERGRIPALPTLRKTKSRGAHRTVLEPASDPQPPASGPLSQYQPVHLELVTTLAQRRLFQQYLQRYHPLGYRVPYGAQLRYLIRSQPRQLLLGCLLFTSAAWKMAPRDAWIGWSDAARRSNLPRVVNNGRFLIFPWVKIPHLASHVLARASRQLPGDWQAAYAVRPVLLETLVDRAQYAGTSYRAANWICVGQTQGRGRMDRTHQAARSIKDIWLYPLARNWREPLCRSTGPGGRREELDEVIAKL